MPARSRLGTRKLTKKQIAAQKAFINAVEDGLVALGARQVEPARKGLGNEPTGGGYEIETKYGTLYVHPYGTWVATRFADVERAKGHGLYGLNPYTGKWNHHFEQPTEDHAEYFLAMLKHIAASENAIGDMTLAETKREARRLAARGNVEGWKVVVGRIEGAEGEPYAIRFQSEPAREPVGDGMVFVPITPYASHKLNPTPSAQLHRKMHTDAIRRQVAKGNVYFGENYAGRPISVGPYTQAAGRSRFAVFIGNTPVQMGSASDAAAHFMAIAKPGSVRPALTNPACGCEGVRENPTHELTSSEVRAAAIGTFGGSLIGPPFPEGGSWYVLVRAGGDVEKMVAIRRGQGIDFEPMQDNPLGWRTPVRPAPFASHVDWNKVAGIVNAELQQTTTDVYASPSKRALKWFKRYEYPSSSAYSISRTEARRLLDHVGIDLDRLVERSINDSFGEYAVNPVRDSGRLFERTLFDEPEVEPAIHVAVVDTRDEVVDAEFFAPTMLEASFRVESVAKDNQREGYERWIVFIDGTPAALAFSGKLSPIAGGYYALQQGRAKGYAPNPMRDVPESVERYYQEALEDHPGITEGAAWALAWSRYCKYKEPGSKHCRLRQSEYLPGKKGKGSAGSGKCRPKKVTLKLGEGPRPETVVITPSSAGTDLFKRADTQLKKWAMLMPARDVWKTDFEVEFEGDRPYEGRIDLSRDYVRQDNMAAHIKRHLTLIAGRGAPANMTPTQYANYLKAIDPTREAMTYAIDLLDNCDLGSSRPNLPTKLTSKDARALLGKEPAPRASTPKKASSGSKRSKTPSKRRTSSRGKAVRAPGDRLKGGLADEGAPIGVDPKQVAMGIEVEREHSDDPVTAREIAYDHLTEDPEYYSKLATIEDDEGIANFEIPFQKFLHHAQRLVDKDTKIGIDRARRYIRVHKTTGYGARSAYAFVDRLTGDVLKPAGWKKPAKGRRGNIYTGNYGVTDHGAAYYSEPEPKRRRAPEGSLIRFFIVDTRDGKVMKSVALSEQQAKQRAAELNAREADKQRFRAEWPIDEVSAIDPSTKRASSKKASPKRASKRASPKRSSKKPSKKPSPKKASPRKRSSAKARTPDAWDMLSVGQGVENDKWRVHRFATSLRVTSLLNAGKRGKKVREFTQSDPPDSFVHKVLQAAAKGASEADMRKLFGHPTQPGHGFYETEHRGVDVQPANQRRVQAKGIDFDLGASPRNFSVQQHDINETRCMPPMRAPVTATKKFYAWAVANEKKIPNMTFSQLSRAMQEAGIRWHQYCGMD